MSESGNEMRRSKKRYSQMPRYKYLVDRVKKDTTTTTTHTRRDDCNSICSCIMYVPRRGTISSSARPANELSATCQSPSTVVRVRVARHLGGGV